MTIEKAKKQSSIGNIPSTDAKDSKKESQRVDSAEIRTKVKEAIKAIELCYNYETGFHYIKQ
ncbi:hypothetical protein [Desulfosporosinus meridiei]|uniref:Uncharacterized protein n=1 Tax=Desulfosporosinus meridiei (strain ATCC BAA-275 / DSM 13257 / KCTC 12902 / NCIMB 13706 / S10) TaxID=768704 RepID=J7ITK5_DESMD|nr:hypothetical protein [Desulfosporosinus meridiei]AFQ45040.1 hypothetical protein Desmer_3159 [Desulfosporosinus meridiei DSM 13257]